MPTPYTPSQLETYLDSLVPAPPGGDAGDGAMRMRPTSPSSVRPPGSSAT